MCTDERDVEALAELSTADCLELLRGHDFGRVAFAADGVPVILPVNYGFEEPHVVVRTAPGLKLDEMPMRIVAFEIDDADPARTWGWSVVVQGPAFEITDSVDPLSVALRASTVQPAAPGERGCWLRISARQVTGRAFGPWRLHAPPSVLSPAGPTPEGDL